MTTILMTTKVVAARKATTGPAKSLRTTASISQRFIAILCFSLLIDGYSCAASVNHLVDTLIVSLFCELSQSNIGLLQVLMLSCTYVECLSSPYRSTQKLATSEYFVDAASAYSVAAWYTTVLTANACRLTERRRIVTRRTVFILWALLASCRARGPK
jgi:hypothetical protein